MLNNFANYNNKTVSHDNRGNTEIQRKIRCRQGL